MFALVQLLAVSHFDTNFIIYDSNYAFGFIDIFAPLSAASTLGIICNTSSSQKNVAASIYNLDIYLTPTIGITTGANFTLKIYYSASDTVHGSGITQTSLIDFKFVGLCQSLATSTDPAANLTSCLI